ncbi:MAG: hypothetical protein H6766_06430 [Candidatus Peribacteria bacterium]|nr:MAG: hypothetical protein H6766_06430 [Candidatus Peribacteria bacterium]
MGTIVSLFITDWWWMMGLLILWMLLPYVALVYPLTLRKTRWIGVIGLFFVLVAFVFAGWLFAAAGIIITGTIAIIRYQDYRIRRFITPSKRVYTTSSDWLYAILIAAVGILVLLHQVETIDLLGCDDINRFLVEQSGRITSLLNKILTLAHQRHINLDDTILVYWQKYQSISQSSCNSIIVR